MGFQIGIDVGGTFTDVVLSNGDGRLTKSKAPSTPDDESKGILNGLSDAAQTFGLERHGLLRNSDVIVLGTTAVTNAMLEYDGANTGLITTGGFRDIIELRRSYREHLFDIRLPAPYAIVERQKRLGVSERIDYTGRIEIPLAENEVRAAVARLAELEVESIAVCLLFSFLNPVHERRVRELVAETLPDIPVTLSSDVLPQVREFERLSTTLVNAYTRPKIQRYLHSLTMRLTDEGFAGELFVMHSNGGMVSVDYAAEHSVELLLSGPAGGVVAGAEVSGLSGYRDVITVDLGGTSYDVCLVEDSTPASGTEQWVSRYRIGTPMVDVHTVGAGGGSIAWIDDGGALRVGPQSAGAFPGPVCYGRGGTEPTVTDADLVLGYISPDYFLGGRMLLDVEASRSAIAERIATPLGLDVIQAASGIFRIVNNSMSNAIRHVTVARGKDPRDFAMCVFGGAGAIHAGAQAPDLGIKTILVPKAASVLSALGNQMANFKITKVRSFIRRTNEIGIEELNTVFAEMLDQAEADLGRQDKITETLSQRFMDVRYEGQTHEVTVPVRSRTRRMTELNLATALAEFHSMHEQLYSFKRPDQPCEVLNLRLDLVGRRNSAGLRSEAFGGEDPAEALRGRRDVFFLDRGGFVDTPVYDGEKVAAGHLISGPAIIEEPDTTIVVYPGQETMADHYRTYVIELQAGL